MITRTIPLRRADGSIRAHALVSAEDYEALAQYRWWVDGYGYACRSEGPRRAKRNVRMHRQILGLEPGDRREGDHKNGNRLDNRRSNLRVLTHAENQQNRQTTYGSSRFRGVCWDKARGLWVAGAFVDGRRVNLGRFDSEEEAARVAAEFRHQHMPGAIETEVAA